MKVWHLKMLITLSFCFGVGVAHLVTRRAVWAHSCNFRDINFQEAVTMHLSWCTRAMRMLLSEMCRRHRGSFCQCICPSKGNDDHGPKYKPDRNDSADSLLVVPPGRFGRFDDSSRGLAGPGPRGFSAELLDLQRHSSGSWSEKDLWLPSHQPVGKNPELPRWSNGKFPLPE